MAGRLTPERQWLNKMHTSIKWRLNGPNIKNPFDANVTDAKIEEYSNDRSSLMEVCELQGVMDETMIVRITDLTDLRYSTDHPNLTGLERKELDEYMTEHGIWDYLTAEVKKLQEECQAELENRRAGM